MLRAIGTRPARMFMIIMLEAAVLAIISIAVGILAGLAVEWFFSVHGINYTGIEFAGVTITQLIYPVPGLRQFTFFPFMVFVFSLTAALYPAVFASRLSPSRAMQRSM